MTPDLPGEITHALEAARAGDPDALNQLIAKVRAELDAVARRLLKGERAGHSWQTGDLVQEALLKLTRRNDWQAMPNSRYLFKAAATTMRQLLIDHARTRSRAKRGGNARRLPLDPVLDVIERQLDADLLEFEDELRKLAEEFPREAEAVELFYFGGYGKEDVARILEVPPDQVQSDLRFAGAWLMKALKGESRDA